MKKCLPAVLILFLLQSLHAASDLSLLNLKGEKQSLSDYRGNIVVLNFWATWCVPCRKEMPLFVQMQSEYGRNGVQWIAVSTDAPEAESEVRKFSSQYELNFPVWLAGTTEHQIAFRLGTGLPATVILDAEGNPRFRIIGESTRETLEERILFLSGNGSADAPDELILPPGITPEHFKEHELGEEEDHDHEEEAAMAGSAVPS